MGTFGYGGYPANAAYGGYGYQGGCGYKGYGYPSVGCGYYGGRWFALIVVLFILLIIVGATFVC
ncbi:YjcZ family sporulation protein [Sporolactobacillus sp. THM7-4]|nr:YjcZ family sporulation protein [Sporolactobacillus sp. THM7-4]